MKCHLIKHGTNNNILISLVCSGNGQPSIDLHLLRCVCEWLDNVGCGGHLFAVV